MRVTVRKPERGASTHYITGVDRGVVKHRGKKWRSVGGQLIPIRSVQKVETAV